MAVNEINRAHSSHNQINQIYCLSFSEIMFARVQLITICILLKTQWKFNYTVLLMLVYCVLKRPNLLITHRHAAHKSTSANILPGRKSALTFNIAGSPCLHYYMATVCRPRCCV